MTNTNKPSVMLSIAFLFLNLFAIFPIAYGLFYGLDSLGFDVKSLEPNLSSIIFAIQLLITSILTCIFLSKHFLYLFGEKITNQFFSIVKVGFIYTTPLLILHLLLFIVSAIRGDLINRVSSFNKFISVTESSGFTLLLFSVLVIIAAVFEECIYRGVLIQKLQKFTNRTTSVFLSSVLFSLSHCIYGQYNLGDLMNNLIVGVLCGFAYISTGSCLSAIIPHLFNNLIFTIFIWIYYLTQS